LSKLEGDLVRRVGAIAFRAQADTSLVRTETFREREYTVVPVIALVEGVIQSMNAEKPEFVSAQDFGLFAVGWNGRPLVMNHPTVDGAPVCANQPQVLADYQIGWVFNAGADDSSLYLEAWVDNELAAGLSTESAEALQAMQNGEVVEVSTGLYALVVPESGVYDGEEYFGVWKNIVPDHLAILPSGVIGACSIADGCGTNRVNTASAEIGWRTATCKSKSKTKSTPKSKMSAEAVSSSDETGCPCGGSSPADCTCKGEDPVKTIGNIAPVNIQANAKKLQPAKEADFSVTRLLANMMPDGMLSSDAMSLVSKALKEAVESDSEYPSGCSCYLIALTNDKAIYEVYDWSDYEYETFQRSYTIAVDGSSVTLGDDVEHVNLVTQVVVRQDPDAAEDVSEAGGGMKASQAESTQEQTMANHEKAEDAKTTTTTNSVELAVNASLAGAGDPNGVTQVTKEAKAGGATGQAHSIDALLNNASPEVREAIEESVRISQARKSELIKSLKETGRCSIPDQRLNSMKIVELEQLVQLAAVPNYGGVSTAAVPAEEQRNSAGFGVPDPILSFPIGKSAA
jgi:hypothetical protein